MTKKLSTNFMNNMVKCHHILNLVTIDTETAKIKSPSVLGGKKAQSEQG